MVAQPADGAGSPGGGFAAVVRCYSGTSFHPRAVARIDPALRFSLFCGNGRQGGVSVARGETPQLRERRPGLENLRPRSAAVRHNLETPLLYSTAEYPALRFRGCSIFLLASPLSPLAPARLA